MTKTISFRTNNDINNSIDMFAKKMRITKTEVINQALTQYLSVDQNKVAKQVAILRDIDKEEDYLSEYL